MQTCHIDPSIPSEYSYKVHSRIHDPSQAISNPSTHRVPTVRIFNNAVNNTAVILYRQHMQ